MNERKLQVIKRAHELFIKKGFQATSIQDILDYSGISKGTFYNYFSSKNELFIALFKTVWAEMESERDALLVGENRTDTATFINQIEHQLRTNRKNKLIPLFEEVIVSNDEELKGFIQKVQLRMLRWYYERFLDLFGTGKAPYLLDCAIMFMGILHQNIKFYSMAHHNEVNIHEVVHYSVGRLVKIVEEVAASEEQLISPDYLTTWMAEQAKGETDRRDQVSSLISSLKSSVVAHAGSLTQIELESCNEMLDFLYEELISKKAPREYLMKSALRTLKEQSGLFKEEDLQKLEEFFGQ